MITLAKYLRRLGVEVDINFVQADDMAQYDLIHLFNLTRITETYFYFQTAKRMGKPVVITPIYWDLQMYYHHTGSRIHLAQWENDFEFRKEILRGCKMIYPASGLEMKLMQKEYGEDLPFAVVYNCIDIEGDFTECIPQKEDLFALCAARICPRKNQLELSAVCHDLGLSLMLVGESKNKAYLNQCIQYPNVQYGGFRQKKELNLLYQSAAVHVLCGFVETPGLSNLEAGAYGCEIVSTTQGSGTEYFWQWAHYCNPYEKDSLKEAIKNALITRYQPMLRKHIIEHFTTERCVQPLYDSYCHILNE